MNKTVLTQDLAGLSGIVGKERSLNEVSQALHFFADSLRPGAVGALHVTCADESETECAEAFRKGFAQYLLPPLKQAHREPMRLANLGGQYEWGAARIAEDHYVAPRGFKLIVVKINSHVGIQIPTTPSAPGEIQQERLGVLRRYGSESSCCGALHALLGGSTLPFAEGTRELLRSEGLDRESILHDDSKVDPATRMLAAALVSSRLQARKAILDIQDYRPSTPTYWLIVSCVTLNRAARDTEIVTGFYVADTRDGDHTPIYHGLGDDPSAYRITRLRQGFIIADDRSGFTRAGRDHRALAMNRLSEIERKNLFVGDERLEQIRQDVAANKHLDPGHARTLLRLALPVLAEVAPVPVAVWVFAEGAVGIHHAFKVDALTRELSNSEKARVILEDIHARIDQLDPDRAEAMVELLVREYSQ